MSHRRVFKGIKPASFMMFKTHLMEPVTKKLKEVNADVSIIPAGLTSELQPLNVSVNKRFKKKVENSLILMDGWRCRPCFNQGWWYTKETIYSPVVSVSGKGME